MDKTDIMLTKLLLINSRLPYRELADKLDLSVNAVHKRIQALKELGIIRTFTAKISISALKALHVLVFGGSEVHSVDEACKELGNHDSTYWVAVAGGNYLYVGAYLQNISELQPYVDFVKEKAQMSDPTVCIVHGEPPVASHDTTLYPLDYRIIYALRKNSRKRVSEVAEEVVVSTKTVRRRLSRIIREGLIELSLGWYPDVSNDIMTVFHLHLKPSLDRRKIGPLFIRKYSPNVLFFWSFSNLPNYLIYVVWTGAMKKLRDIPEGFQSEEVFESIVPNVLYTGYIYDTWRDRLVSEKGAAKHREID